MELLAPAGTLACVKAAVNSGADAVYFAGKGFGARSFAGNLSEDEIFYATDYCHLRSARAYVTVNTLTFDREFKELKSFIKTLTKAGVDGVIVQDLGVLRLIREISPDIELHGSTQMTIHSADGVRALEKLGVSRVVLSRELSGKEIAEITKSVSAEIEVFVHGAMCMSYSGQCLMSSVIGGRSGNRGKCAQPCRLTFSADGKNPKHYLSLKDMSYASHLCELSEMGVASLKIEGRMKGEEYVSAVVSAYRRLIDEKRQPTREEIDGLNKVFFRGGLSDGYYVGSTGKQMFAFDKPDNPYLKNDADTEVPDNRQIEAQISAKIRVGEYPAILLTCGEYSAEAYADEIIQPAAKRPATEDGVREQLIKTGGTPFKISDIELDMSDNAFVPVSQLNELRRRGISALEDKILSGYKNKRFIEYDNTDFKNKSLNKTSRFTCSVLDIEQYRLVKNYSFERIYIPLHIVEENTDELLENPEKIVVSLPVILRGEDREKYKSRMTRLKKLGFSKAELHTIDGIDICDGFELYGSQRMNVSNSLAVKELSDMGIDNICLSAELNIPQIRDISKAKTTEVIAYGKIPVMITENCIQKNLDRCPCSGIGEMTDRMGAKFPIIKDGDICRSVVLNNVPLYTADKLEEMTAVGADYLRLIFTDEDRNLCREICEAYLNRRSIEKTEYTRLHLFKGAVL